MNWYKGGITEAIIKSKTKGAIFVVYIEGKDEKSTHFNQLTDGEEVAGKLGGDNFVAIKLEAGTLSHQQFCEIYKDTPIPSIYFIGKQGTPLEIVKDSKDVRSLSECIDEVLRKAGYHADRSAAKQSENFIESEKKVSKPMVCENDVCTVKKDLSPDQASTSKDNKQELPELTAEEKVERAKHLVEKKRDDKQKQEEEEERLKEIERRKVGKDVTELKRWQNEQELKQLLEEREREKREGQAARDRVLAQIAQDKAERASRFSNITTTQTPSSPQPSTSQSPSSTKPINTNIVRLQFRIPDGKSVTQDFKIDDTLADIYAFIDKNIKLPFNRYVLSTTFPRREYTNEERDKSLLELELAPSAVLLILPIGGGVNSGIGGGPISPLPNMGLNQLFWTLISPFLNVFGYFRGLIFGGNNGNTTETNRRSANTPTDSNRSQQKQRTGETTVVQRHGNVHRLSNRNDSDDENNTWNGNSTQQM